MRDSLHRAPSHQVCLALHPSDASSCAEVESYSANACSIFEFQCRWFLDDVGDDDRRKHHRCSFPRSDREARSKGRLCHLGSCSFGRPLKVSRRLDPSLVPLRALRRAQLSITSGMSRSAKARMGSYRSVCVKGVALFHSSPHQKPIIQLRCGSSLGAYQLASSRADLMAPLGGVGHLLATWPPRYGTLPLFHHTACF